MKKIILSLMLIFLTVVIVTSACADDSALFVASVSPDALIILDMSGSMQWDPAGILQYMTVYPNRRIDIARRVLKDLLDDNNDNNINSTDEESLNVRLGYMRFWSAYNNDDGNPDTGSIIVRSEIGDHYSDIWQRIIEAGWDELSAYLPYGGTPLAASLVEAKTYYEHQKSHDSAKACRKKFIILITDGADTYGCNGNGNTTTPQMRMLTVQRTKALFDAGYSVFVVGFGGTMPAEQQRTLNWAAKYGGTSNPDSPYSGDEGAYDITQYLPASPLDACSSTANLTALDPGTYELSGYAFLPESSDALAASLKTIFAYIAQKSYAYTSPTVPAVRVTEGNTVYISSFEPNDTPYWSGTFRAYTLNEDGTLPLDNGLPVNPIWDAGELLKAKNANSRKIYVNLDGSRTPKEFLKTIVQPGDLGFSGSSSISDRDKLVDHIRGIDAYDINHNHNTTEQRLYKLGDIFHSNGVIVGEPSRYFLDEGYNGTNGFYATRKDRKKVILTGANDGMLHAFDAATGSELWGFIPKSLLTNLQQMRTSHTYYVDSSPKVADVWFYSDATDTTKTVGEWKTVLICGLRKGGNSYFALDITDTENPKFLWEFPKSSDDADKVGESWSEPVIGRVKIEGTDGKLYERWVAFIGGGYPADEHHDSYHNGSSFFVIDVMTGDILWDYYFLADDEHEQHHMAWGLPSAPTAVDVNYDGFIEKVYIGDLGGNMWVFDVSANETTKKSNSLWSGLRLFDGNGHHPIYYQPAVAFDKNGTPWVFWGTGDREDPTNKTSGDIFYAVKDDKDDGAGYPYSESNLTNVTTAPTTFHASTTKGWYIELATSEKVLARPTVFSGIVYFTTYTPGEKKECSVEGTGRLYFTEFLSGGGAVDFSDAKYLNNETSARYVVMGGGVPSAPVISVNSKGKASVIAGTTDGGVYSRVAHSKASNKELLYWREVTP
jgi:type IV pilus assembly protein PilY1